MGKLTISMAIFNSYVSLPEGISPKISPTLWYFHIAIEAMDHWNSWFYLQYSKLWVYQRVLGILGMTIPHRKAIQLDHASLAKAGSHWVSKNGQLLAIRWTAQ